MNHINNAIRFNAEASRLILSGRYTDALKILSATMQALKVSSRRHRGMQMDILIASNVEQSLSSSLSSPPKTVPKATSNGYIFREPIVVSDLNGDPANAHRRMVATVLYNLALAHHLQGLRVQQSETTKTASKIATYHLQTAQSMYQACLKVQIKHRFNLGDFYKLLVLPNNIGQVAMALGKTQSAKGYMAFLAKQLDQFLQGSNESGGFPFREREIEEFLHNTTRLTNNSFVSTSATPAVQTF